MATLLFQLNLASSLSQCHVPKQAQIQCTHPPKQAAYLTAYAPADTQASWVITGTAWVKRCAKEQNS